MTAYTSGPKSGLSRSAASTIPTSSPSGADSLMEKLYRRSRKAGSLSFVLLMTRRMRAVSANIPSDTETTRTTFCNCSKSKES